jgi:serine/threonine protein kinase
MSHDTNPAPERWARIKSIFSRALELPVADRPAFLANEAADDPALVGEVESLLRSHEQPGDFLDAIPMDMRADAFSAGGQVGLRVGAYRTVELIGSGGMGDVYRAVRDDDLYRAEVAIKLMRRDMAFPFAEKRFRIERQILAQLEHRNIARLLDGGTTEDGLPYVVMELIAGEPIDEYCNSRGLDVRHRIQLFLQVCAAVRYAHQHLVVHRDLKPSNILVTADGGVKLLDFGIAKLLEAKTVTGGASEETRTQMRAMTLEYASPEQLSGTAVTTVSDVYSLGVVLYRLLTGASPYRAASSDAQRAAEILSDATPTPPSAAATAALGHELDADLDDILLMALRKEPDQRYGSVEQFASDLRAYLSGLPVAARGDALRYRLAKFATRHKIELAAAAAVLLALILGLGLALREARIAERERQTAQRHFESVRRLSNTLMFEIDDSLKGIPGTTPARKLVVQRAQEYLAGLSLEPSTDPTLLLELAVVYAKLADILGARNVSNLGDYAGALANYREAVTYIESAARSNSRDPAIQREQARIYGKLAGALWASGMTDEAQTYERKGVAVSDAYLAAHSDDAEMLFVRGKLYELTASFERARSNLDSALVNFQRAHELYGRSLGSEPGNEQWQQNLAYSHKHIGAILIVQQKYPDALRHYRAAHDIEAAQLARDAENVEKRYNITYTYNDTAYILSSQGDVRGALEYYRKTYEIRKALSDADPSNVRMRSGVAYSLRSIGKNLMLLNDYERALRAFADSLAEYQALAQREADLGSSPDVAVTQGLLGAAHLQMARRSSAGPERQSHCRQSLEWSRKAQRGLEQTETGDTSAVSAGAGNEVRENIAACERLLGR